MTVVEYLKNDETKERIIALIKGNLYLYQGINTESKMDVFSGALYNMFVRECVQNNQYVSLSNRTIKRIGGQYRSLVEELKGIQRDAPDNALRRAVERHRDRLVRIIEANEYAESADQLIVPCFEYTEDFQERILRIRDAALSEPIIDIGCGKNCALVRQLRKKGYAEVFGIDQYLGEEDFIIASNWFDFEFKRETYGTIISHMAFTNHYKRSVVFQDGKARLYERKYGEILGALKKGGKFIYSPALPFVESNIDTDAYSVTKYGNTEDAGLDTVVVSRR